eukprot:scaffold200190_cov21-Tisochrysis_lutea.AAC.3
MVRVRKAMQMDGTHVKCESMKALQTFVQPGLCEEVRVTVQAECTELCTGFMGGGLLSCDSVMRECSGEAVCQDGSGGACKAVCVKARQLIEAMSTVD